MKGGHKTRYQCSQDKGSKKKEKKSTKGGVKHRDNVGMKQYPCHGRLVITCHKNEKSTTTITVRLTHSARHVDYVDVSMPPGAIQMIRENIKWMTPVAMVALKGSSRVPRSYSCADSYPLAQFQPAALAPRRPPTSFGIETAEGISRCG